METPKSVRKPTKTFKCQPCQDEPEKINEKYDCIQATMAKVINHFFKLFAQRLTKRRTDVDKETRGTRSERSREKTTKSYWDKVNQNVVPIAKNIDEFTAKQDAEDLCSSNSIQFPLSRRLI